MNNTVAWLALALSFLTSVVTVTFFLSALHSSVDTLAKGQDKLDKSLTAVVAEFTVAIREVKGHIEPIRDGLNAIRVLDAAAGVAFKDLENRVASLEDRIDSHDDDIIRSRTRIHLLANKLMAMDPNWRGLTEGD